MLSVLMHRHERRLFLSSRGDSLVISLLRGQERRKSLCSEESVIDLEERILVERMRMKERKS